MPSTAKNFSEQVLDDLWSIDNKERYIHLLSRPIQSHITTWWHFYCRYTENAVAIQFRSKATRFDYEFSGQRRHESGNWLHRNAKKSVIQYNAKQILNTSIHTIKQSSFVKQEQIISL